MAPGEHPRPEAVERRPEVVILATGGTIAGTAESATQPGYAAARLAIGDMIAGVPGLHALAAIRGEQIASVGSQDMTFAIMITLANRINALLGDRTVQGVVVTHGTDTMEETAYFLNLTVNSRKPVVLTGAMRPFEFRDTDAFQNVFEALLACRLLPPGVYVSMHSKVLRFPGVRKNRDSLTFVKPV
jgi:L-asparaginase